MNTPKNLTMMLFATSLVALACDAETAEPSRLGCPEDVVLCEPAPATYGVTEVQTCLPADDERWGIIPDVPGGDGVSGFTRYELAGYVYCCSYLEPDEGPETACAVHLCHEAHYAAWEVAYDQDTCDGKLPEDP